MNCDRNIDDIRLSEAVTVATQLRTLRVLLVHIRKAVDTKEKPVVEIDLDLTAVMPIYRTRRALTIAGELGGIELFTKPELLPILPGYSDEAWLSFIHQMNLETTFSNIQWTDGGGKPNKAVGEPFAAFHEAYWTTEWIADDTPTPGLGMLVHRIEEIGGEVVFLSGRWLPEHVEPTLTTLRRAGVQDPKLVIGNDRHSTLVLPDRALSDAQAKVHHQDTIRNLYGPPVAIIDDRVTNRTAIIEAIGPTILGVAACIPRFTYDIASAKEPFRLSTFEMFDHVLGESPHRPYMSKRYHALGSGRPWAGLYEGVGINKLPYVLPRIYSNNPVTSIPQPFADLIRLYTPGSLEETELVRLCQGSIPADQVARVNQCIVDAEHAASEGLAAPFPGSDEERFKLRLTLVVSWLHSRDVEHVMRALGYYLPATGIHDIEEWVPAREIQRAIKNNQETGTGYSDWLLRWVEGLNPDDSINVGCLNPVLAAGMWRWTPNAVMQDAMDVHRVSSHHQGDGNERYDPIEAAINNVLHQREGTLGIRKEPIQGWKKMLQSVERDTRAEALAKSSVGRQALRDAIEAAIVLEASGCLTPWGLVVGADFVD